jgi:formylglycine-generating enzyme required for sulfatase activity
MQKPCISGRVQGYDQDMSAPWHFKCTAKDRLTQKATSLLVIRVLHRICTVVRANTTMTEPKRLAKYEIFEEIGRGASAVVYRANDTTLDRIVALKVIHNAPDEPAFARRFQQEARTAAKLRHPNIVPVYDFGDADGVLYLAMALIGAGRTLRDLLAKQERLTLKDALQILAPLADALDHLHQQSPPLTHRDVKPSNVLVEGEGEDLWVVLTDFGLVRSLEASTKLTQSSTILGTPTYLPPEQAQPERWGEITPLADVYALGVVAYEMLVGRPPFVGELATVLHAHAYEPPPSALEFVPDLGENLADVLTRALAKPPADRYPSAGALVAALRQVAEDRAEASAREATLEQLEAQARELLDGGGWLEALDCCTQMIRLDPDRPAAVEMLTAAKEGLDRERAEAVERRRLEERYRAGLTLLEGEKWKQAIAAFEEVAEANPDFQDVQARLTQACDERQRAGWYDEAITHGEAGRWAEACRAWLKVLRGRLDYRDGDAAVHLLDATEELLAKYEQARQACEALALYDTLGAAVGEQDWERATEAGERLLQLAPELDQPRAWLARAHDELEQHRFEPQMIVIPAGRFLMGTPESEIDELFQLMKKELKDTEREWVEQETPQHEVSLDAYAISRYPVTNAEFACFVEDGVYENPEYWTDAGWEQKESEHWTRPRFWEYNRLNGPSQPVVGVSWYEVLAYCNWLAAKSGRPYRLPTEAEWEKAARSIDGRRYPWGDEWDPGHCNNSGTGPGFTTPVGQYPKGDSPFGVSDMVGQVWEWCSSKYEGTGGKPKFGYPYNPGDGREDLEGDDRRVVRGGSLYDLAGYCRCAVRYWYLPRLSRYYVGFRCVRTLSS